MKLSANGIDVSLEFDEDGFPIVHIDTYGGYYDEHYRPAVEIRINDELVRSMFRKDCNPVPELDFLTGILTYVQDGNVQELRPCGFVQELQDRIEALSLQSASQRETSTPPSTPQLNPTQVAELDKIKNSENLASLYRSLHHVGDDTVKAAIEEALGAVLDPDAFKTVKAVFQIFTDEELMMSLPEGFWD